MKKMLFILVLFSFGFIVSCTQKDCSCRAVQTKKLKATSSDASVTYPVYDWGSSCSSISENDIPEISNSGENYQISCEEM
ncbi:MAG: hypothetical protein LBM25_00420 [Bacteroidales bacterium]|nr:hypothetical protein [Bacteroidales bacterium]